MPVPAAARMTWTPSPLRVSAQTSWRCSSLRTRPSAEGGVDLGLLRNARALPAPPDRAVEQLPLDDQQIAGRVAPLAGDGIERDDLAAPEERIGLGLDFAQVRAFGRHLGQRLQDVATREGRGLARQPIRAGELDRGPLASIHVTRARQPRSPDDGSHAVAAQAMLCRPGAPVLPQPIQRNRVVLAAARLERRDLGRASRALAAIGHMLEDLRPPPREVLDDPTRDANEVRRPALDGEPPHAKPLGQLRAQRRVVEVARGLRVPVERAAVERGPAPVRALSHVRDHDVRVQQRIPGARRAMLERRRHEAAALYDRRAATAASRLTSLALEIAERLADRGPMRRADGLHDCLVGDREHDAHALWSSESQVEAGHGAEPEPLPEREARRRVLAAQQPQDSLLADLAAETERGRAGADPPPGISPSAA